MTRFEHDQSLIQAAQFGGFLFGGIDPGDILAAVRGSQFLEILARPGVCAQGFLHVGRHLGGSGCVAAPAGGRAHYA